MKNPKYAWPWLGHAGTILLVAASALSTSRLDAQVIGRAKMSKESKECIDCHKKQNQGLYQQWGASKHYRANIGCYECHAAEKTDKDGIRSL